VVVARELHFSRAAQQLFVSQQALSRDIQRLEDRMGARLLDRTTRRVALTPAGETMLARAQELLTLFDSTLEEVRGQPRSLTVDIVGPDLTPALVLAKARELRPELEFFARFHTGTEAAVPLVLAERLDVTFGRHGVAAEGLRYRPVRHEPVAVLVPQDHPLAGLAAIPLESLRGTGLCIRAGNHATPGWAHVMRQLLAPFGTDPESGHPHVQGNDELAQHIRDRNAPILTMSTQPAVPGAVLRPLIEPAALFPWTMIWRADTDHPGIRALHQAVDALSAPGDWLSTSDGSWLPEPEASGQPA
jgi:DNA-binding transcriptional LysR family regulator